jgi:hypothetical protein
MSTSMRRASAFLFLLCGMLSGFGQQRKPAAVALRELTRQSGYIFAGRVTAIEYVAPKTPNQVATMRVTFHVEQAFRGTRAGTNFTVENGPDCGTRVKAFRRLRVRLPPMLLA